MSEEILKALMQLFALITKQDGGVEEKEKSFVRKFLTQQLSEDKVRQYYSLFEQHAGLDTENERFKDQKPISVIDSVKVLGICKKINKTLDQNQKIVVLVRLFELVETDKKFTDQRLEIINTVGEVFRISKSEASSVRSYILNDSPDKFNDSNILVINDKQEDYPGVRKLRINELDGNLLILHIPSVDLYFMRYTGKEDLFLNGLPIVAEKIYLFANGSTVKVPKGKPVYYSDISSHFMHDRLSSRINFSVENLTYKFASGVTGLRRIDFREEQGNLVGIMGASGSGKTTLVNVLSGITDPTKGSVKINGLNLHSESGKLQGIIGLIPQDDLLIEELTVFENLYYNAKLCFRNLNKEELTGLVHKTLRNLGLYEIRELKVGSPLNKLISGGQRKRLNIALELVREPAILFVDEPTSGLSSRDSENVMDLLRELALKGKLIFVVIHQPSSEIFKMFDRVIIMDVGGYLIYYGNPVEAVMYFKRRDAQINSDIGECPVCGNVNPELIFNIIEARIVDEFGRYTNLRKVSPEKWEELYREEAEKSVLPDVTDQPEKNLSIPGWFRQFVIYWIRDLKSKITNRQYIMLTLLEAPVLAFILSYIIRYIADPTSDVYIFRENENIPIYIFMSIIVALFLGLIVSAEEIFRDRKILKREKFLHLSRSAYLLSKIFILLSISAIQAFTFVLIANSILGITGMGFYYWFAWFSTAACANILGLVISSSFNSAITIYIIVPLLMIPMMILSGAMFSFDKLNRRVGSIDKVPWIAELMIPKWSYEALMVQQFKNNRFQKHFYEIKKTESIADFKQVYWLKELQRRCDRINKEFMTSGAVKATSGDLRLLQNEIRKENILLPAIRFEQTDFLVPGSISQELLDKVLYHLVSLDDHYASEFFRANTERENKIRYFMENHPGIYNQLKDTYHNESVSDYVRKVYEKNKMVEYKYELIQQIDPVFLDPFPKGPLSFRSHFFAPRKYFMNRYVDTYWFNMSFIWFLAALFYLILYFDLEKFMKRIFPRR